MAIMRVTEENCDLYVFHNGHQYEIYVAHSRRKPESECVPETPLNEYAGQDIEFIMQDMRKNLVTIDHPKAGASMAYDTAQETLDEVLALEASGLGVSQNGIERLRVYALKEKAGK